jgi:hypothetical protein
MNLSEFTFKWEPLTQDNKFLANKLNLFVLPAFTKSRKQPPISRQLQSPFLSKLLFDVRLLIYRQVVLDIGRTLHISSNLWGKSKKLSSRQCLAPPDDLEDLDYGFGEWFNVQLRSMRPMRRDRDANNEATTLMGLLLSCRRV